jgi:transposase
MAERTPGIHVVTTSREYKGKVYKSHLLRRSFREGDKVRKETLANLTPLGDEIVEWVRLALSGVALGPVEKLFEVVASRHHGHVAAVLLAMDRLGFAELLASRPSRQRSLVMAMVVAKLLEPDNSKLSIVDWWRTTTLPELLGVGDADEDELYEAMDWLLERQGTIEKKLAARHLRNDGVVLYDLSSSYFEGKTCPLAALGHSRDGKKGTLQVNYGLLNDVRGCPVSVSVFKGNTADPKTLLPQVKKAQQDFGLERLVLVGDRGMITQTQLDTLKTLDGVDWITALRTEGIRKLMDSGELQLGLFDTRNLFELSSPAFPGERLVACLNPELTKLRAAKRQSLLASTARELEKVRAGAGRGKLRGRAAIGVRVGKVVNKYKVGKHFKLEIRDDGFDYRVDEANVAREAALDGLYVVRTSLPVERLGAEDTVRGYKSLARVERAFRTFKTIDLRVRPICHHLEDRVRAHIFLCMLTYYVQWHMQEVLRPLTYADDEIWDDRETRDPVAPAKPSASARAKAATKRLDDGTRVRTFSGILADLATIVRNTSRRPNAPEREPTFAVDTSPSPAQRRVLDLLASISP